MPIQYKQHTVSINSNLDRANVAGEGIDLFAARTGISDEDGETRVRDMLANIMHYCDVNDVDFKNAFCRANDNYEAEVEQES